MEASGHKRTLDSPLDRVDFLLCFFLPFHASLPTSQSKPLFFLAENLCMFPLCVRSSHPLWWVFSCFNVHPCPSQGNHLSCVIENIISLDGCSSEGMFSEWRQWCFLSLSLSVTLTLFLSQSERSAPHHSRLSARERKSGTYAHTHTHSEREKEGTWKLCDKPVPLFEQS